MKPNTTTPMLGLAGVIVVVTAVFFASDSSPERVAFNSLGDQQPLQVPRPARDSTAATRSETPFGNSPAVQQSEEASGALASASPALAAAELAAASQVRTPAMPDGASESHSTKIDLPTETGANPNEVEVPLHWTLTGESASQLQLITDRRMVWNGSASAQVLPKRDAYNLTWGATHQASLIGPYRAKRVEFSAHVRTSELWGGASLWLRADDAQGVVVAFDNAMSRMRRGDSSWERMSIVLDIPEDAAYLHYGLLMMGTGRAWIDQAAFEIVIKDVPVTAPPYARRPLGPYRAPQRQAPENMDFEETVHIDKTLVQ